jgi:hypothetical protein
VGSIIVTPVAAQGKNTVNITMAATVTKVTVTRQDPIGAASLIRYGDQVPTPGGHVIMDDFEAPLDVQVTYTVTQAVPTGSETYTSAKVVLPSLGLAWLKDPGFPSMNFRVNVLTSIETISRPSRAGIFPILDRVHPVVVTTKRQGDSGVVVLHTLSDAERTSLTDLLARGTALLLQVPNAYAFGSQYIYVGDVDEDRVGLAMEPARKWSLPFVAVDRPEGLYTQPTGGKTWGDVKAVNATWADLKANGKTWQRLLEEGP